MADVLDRERGRRLARSEAQGGDAAAVQRGDALLQHVVGRVHDAGVDVCRVRQAKQVRGVLGIAELVAGRLVDRNGDRVGGRIAAVARMKNERLGMLAVGRHGHSPRVGGDYRQHCFTTNEQGSLASSACGTAETAMVALMLYDNACPTLAGFFWCRASGEPARGELVRSSIPSGRTVEAAEPTLVAFSWQRRGCRKRSPFGKKLPDLVPNQRVWIGSA